MDFITRYRQLVVHFVAQQQANALTLVLTGTVLFAVLAIASHLYTLHELEKSLAEQSILARRVSQMDQAVRESQQRGDFLNQLPQVSDAAAITLYIQQQSLAKGVVLVTLLTSNVPLTTKALGHTAWDVTLRGTYPNIKAVLAGLLEQSSSLRLQSLKFTRSSAQEIEAQVKVVQWVQPFSPKSEEP